MPRPHEFIADALRPSLSAGRSDLFSELGEFFKFIWEELKPFPGRGHAVVRLVVAVVAAVIVSETLRIPEPAFTAYLIFFIINEDGVSSIKVGLLSLMALTVALAAATGVTICFMDAPWFRLPATFLLIAGAVWLSRTMVVAVVGRVIAVIFALYLSLADTIFNAESLTESTLWLWSVVAMAVGIAVVVSLLLEPKPELLLRAQIEANLSSVQRLLQAISTGHLDRFSEAKALRRQVYGAPQRMKQLLARWRQRQWPIQSINVDWDLAIFIVERFLTISATLAGLNRPVTDEKTRLVLAQLSGIIGQLKQAVHDRDHEAIRSLAVPSTDDLPDSLEKTGIIELVAALSDGRSLLILADGPHKVPAAAKAASPKPWALIPDALTNPEHIQFAIKTTLAVLACEVFLNAVDWPGIRTCMITCVVTALATEGAQRQKQLLRLTGACTGGVMGLACIIYLIPQMDSIVGFSLLIAGGTACCAWVAAGSVRTSYAGFQMALAFYIMLLPGFVTSIDLTTIRDRFVGILVGITAMWIFFDHLWYTSSRRQVIDKLIALLQLMAKAPGVVSAAMSPTEARTQATQFRRSLSNALDGGRLSLDETKIELTLALKPHAIRGSQLEIVAAEVSFAAFLLIALNEKKVRALAAGQLGALQPSLQPADESIAQSFTAIADTFHRFHEAVLRSPTGPPPKIGISQSSSNVTLPPESTLIGHDLRSIYQTLQDCLTRISHLDWIVRALP